ncbi:MAG: polysaccharide deacetylase family protein [Bacteroidota bacterium]
MPLHLYLGFGQTPTIAERLGYTKTDKLLIIHADYLGVSHAENSASIHGMEMGSVNSASIMVPCPWFPEIADYAKKHPQTEFGIHLTLTSEWKFYKWGPVTSKDSVLSLVNDQGYFYDTIADVATHADPKHVEIELRNQVKMAYAAGINVTHLDTHMGAAMSTKALLAAYIKIGQEFDLPVLLDHQIDGMAALEIQHLIGDTDVIVDQTLTAMPRDFERGMDLYYTHLLRNLSPGLNCLLIHLAFEDAEIQAMTIDHPHWGAAWRQADHDFFTSTLC